MKQLFILIACLIPAVADAEPRAQGLDSLGLELRLNDAPWEEPPDALLPRGSLPGQLPGVGETTVVRALLTRPTSRYRHGILGDNLEAGGLVIKWVNGTGAELVLPEDSVFEELTPRVANANRGAGEEVILVRSYLDAGAALAVVGFNGRELAILAETPPLGAPNRWLNPVGVGDLTGDGRPEIAYVETPHIGGILKIVRMEEGRLTPLHGEAGYSNHAIGSRYQLLGGVHDLNRDGRAEILVPDQTRRSLHILSFDGTRFTELARIDHGEEIYSNFTFFEADETFYVRYRLRDGTVVTLWRS